MRVYPVRLRMCIIYYVPSARGIVEQFMFRQSFPFMGFSRKLDFIFLCFYMVDPMDKLQLEHYSYITDIRFYAQYPFALTYLYNKRRIYRLRPASLLSSSIQQLSSLVSKACPFSLVETTQYWILDSYKSFQRIGIDRT